jgi:hypothetical protein
MRHVVGYYIRLKSREIDRLKSNPDILPKYDPRVALGDGRGIDLGRAWEELGVFLDGGVHIPDAGPTVGEQPMPSTDVRATWSYVEPSRVVELAEQLRVLRRDEFSRHYDIDGEDTADSLPGSRTAGFGDRAGYMYKKLRILASHYADAAEQGEGMLVRIGERI